MLIDVMSTAGLVAALVIGFYLIYITLKAEQAKRCPHCGSAQRAHVWDEVWMCRGCYRGLCYSPVGAQLIDDERLLEAADRALMEAQDHTARRVIYEQAAEAAAMRIDMEGVDRD